LWVIRLSHVLSFLIDPVTNQRVIPGAIPPTARSPSPSSARPSAPAPR
jgi:hypothetical protein